MGRLRWGDSEAPTDESAARDRLIGAAAECFLRYGVMKTTVEDVATLANVSRATVYRYFSGRDDLILGVLLRDARRLLDDLAPIVDDADSLSDGIVAGVVQTLQAIGQNRNLALLFAPDAAGLTAATVGASDALFTMTAAFLRPRFESAQAAGVLRAGIDLDEAAEWTLRCILSFITVEGARRRTTDQLHRYLETYLLPALIAPKRTAT